MDRGKDSVDAALVDMTGTSGLVNDFGAVEWKHWRCDKRINDLEEKHIS